MKIRFYIDPDTNEPHIYNHDVTEQEVVDFFTERQYLEAMRSDGSHEAIGRLSSGRCLRVAYRLQSDQTPFVITAYDITDRETITLLEDQYESDR